MPSRPDNDEVCVDCVGVTDDLGGGVAPQELGDGRHACMLGDRVRALEHLLVPVGRLGGTYPIRPKLFIDTL